MPAAHAFLPDGRRLHLHHGPIDLIVDATGPGREAALAGAVARFDGLLEELVAELPALRTPVGEARLEGPVALAMAAAVAPFADSWSGGAFITPMAAVAGAVADEILRVMVAAGDLARAYVNNGGDVAVHLAPGESFTAAGAGGDRIRMTHDAGARGMATSGWRGRSHSFGIADNVTTLAATAAAADAAATMTANAVDLPGSTKISRAPANTLQPDSDLGARPVTTDVGALDADEIALALGRGEAFARVCLDRRLVTAALLGLSGARRVVMANRPGARGTSAFGAPIEVASMTQRP